MHAGDQRHFGRLATLAQTDPAGAQHWIVAHGTQRAHVESGADSCASSPNAALALGVATVTVERGNTHQRGELFMRQRAQLRQIRQQGEREDRPDPRDTAQQWSRSRHSGLACNVWSRSRLSCSKACSEPGNVFLQQGTDGGR